MGEEIVKALIGIFEKLLPLAAVWFGWLLATRSQRLQKRQDAFEARMKPFREVLEISDQVPHNLTVSQLAALLIGDEEFRIRLTGFFTRLVGIRNERTPYLQAELREFIDQKFKPLVEIKGGDVRILPSHLEEFARVALELVAIVKRIEGMHIREYDSLIK